MTTFWKPSENTELPELHFKALWSDEKGCKNGMIIHRFNEQERRNKRV